MKNLSTLQTTQEKAAFMGGQQIAGMPLFIFLGLATCVLFSGWNSSLPLGMVGALALMFVLGTLLTELGERIMPIREYLGGGTILAIFGGTALFEYQLLPVQAGQVITNFMKEGGFLNFFIASLVTGSVFGMSGALLKNAAMRYLPVILGGVALALLSVGLVGSLMGYGFKNAVLLIGLPIMGGGMGAGAVPLVEILSGPMQMSSADLLSRMVPAVVIANTLAILVGSLLARLGRCYPSLTGNGKLMVKENSQSIADEQAEAPTLQSLGMGLFISSSMFVLGSLLGNFIPMHPFALMILAVAFIKVSGLLPRRYEQAAADWYQFVVSNLTPSLLVGIGVAYTSIPELISAFSISYFVLVMVTVIGGALGAALVGRMIGFYPIEAAITGGLCMANMGGTGDVAVLSAAQRMKLMPFAQISSRLGGAVMLILATALISLLA
ncbi:citrate:sodium symporter [Aeromonas veronii]|jgi:Na+/citrate or Na+/malate symporter|uniref:2-hydroxycarboxylate transporter family protein n=1 Tax=Aeromonas TaxID=642 RepID=UPI000E56E3DA|nr:2-hydroxycarboxylate transporter family protein [Aeromonas veronii]AXV20257.1 citrate:sodium symporter [Aeromonas veronii]MBA2799722.1 2-hydroxycarboxylate transporter family protein [Aeromonas veronii]MCX0444458.1 2-hydroxycarboxylate transporter family protein [Aeromonas veronii]UJP33423.1 2-hydroxycarboxylate transporter family protein [Aeromonas veronii]HDO1374802.1 2-hydroxycarboxylate transporter family protein [Aeromonas veronii]